MSWDLHGSPGCRGSARVIMPGAIIARIESDARMASANGTALTSNTHSVVREVFEALEVSPIQ